MSKTTVLRTSALAALLCLAGSSAFAQGIEVDVNGNPVRFEGTEPQEVRGRVMVPLRGVLEQMGAYVDWNAATRTVLARRGDTNIELPIDSDMARVNGRRVRLDVPAMVMGGSTMVPLRFVSEALGANVDWNAGNRTVMIDTNRSASYHYGRNDNAPIQNAYDRNPGHSNVDNQRDDRPANVDRSTPRGRAHRTGAARFTLPVGTVIPVTMNDTLSSRNSRPGDRFTATLHSGQDDAGLPAGTKIEGVVREALPAEGDKPGVLDVDFRRIIFPDGESHSIDASLISLNDGGIRHDSSGRMVASTSNKSNERLKFIGIGAGAGLLIGALTKGNTLLDTLLGAGAGYAYNELRHQKPADVALKPGTEFGVRLNSQLAYYGDASSDRNYNDRNTDDRYFNRP